MEVWEAVTTRRSVRHFTSDTPPPETIDRILAAGSWAPSGKNNQPWRFIVVSDPQMREALANFTIYGKIIRSAPVAVAAFMDLEASYNRDKDLQAIGACLQNILLAAHADGLGAVWLGEILNRKDEVRTALGLPATLELMAVIALGYPRHPSPPGERKNLNELILKRI